MTRKFLTPLQKKFNEISKKYSSSSSSAIMKKEDEDEESGLVFADLKKTAASSGNDTSTALKSAEKNTNASQNTPLSDSVENSKNDTPASEIREGALIKNRVSTALEEKLGVPDTKKVLDKINDAEVEKNIPVAKETVSQNINSGKISKYQTEKYPYMLDAFAVMYAANNIGNKKLENNLYKLAYMEEEKSPKIENYSAKINSPYKNTVPKLQPRFADELLKNAIKNVKGDSYYDFTVNGKGLDAELDPTPLEAAKMVEIAGAVLAAGAPSNVQQSAEINGWRLTKEIYQNGEGLDIAVFKKVVKGGKDCYVIVNVGSEKKTETKEQLTEFGVDLVNNIQQPFGLSKDMKDSIEFAQKFVEKYPGANIIFVGHSKGGAEAAANAVATGKKAILFNPAKANLDAYGLNVEGYDGEITSYVVDGEILDQLLPLLPLDDVGDKIYLSAPESSKENPSSWVQYLKDIVGDSIDKHKLKTIIEILEEIESDEKN